MDTSIVNSQLSGLIYDKEQVNLIRNTVAKGATDDELKIFLYLAQQYNLDPFKKEIWFTKYAGQTNIMTSRDGYLKYAQTHPQFGGLISFVVHEGDAFEIDAAEYKITHKFGTKRGKIIGAWARCDRKGKRPFISYVSFEEYNQNNPIWKKYPSAMIQKVAEVFVLKRAFGINGLVTREEIADDLIEHQLDIEKNKIPMMKKDQKASIWEIAQAKGISIDNLKQYAIKEFDTPLTCLSYKQAEDLIKKLSKMEQYRNNDDLAIEEKETLNNTAPTL